LTIAANMLTNTNTKTMLEIEIQLRGIK